MSASVPLSTLTTEQLLRLGQFNRPLADALDAALVGDHGTNGVVPYIATGSESASGFVIPIGKTLPTSNYRVSFYGVEADIISPAAWEFHDKTTTDFTAEFAGDGLTPGGLYLFQINTDI